MNGRIWTVGDVEERRGPPLQRLQFSLGCLGVGLGRHRNSGALLDERAQVVTEAAPPSSGTMRRRMQMSRRQEAQVAAPIAGWRVAPAEVGQVRCRDLPAIAGPAFELQIGPSSRNLLQWSAFRFTPAAAATSCRGLSGC